MFVPWQAFSALSNICGQAQEPSEGHLKDGPLGYVLALPCKYYIRFDRRIIPNVSSKEKTFYDNDYWLSMFEEENFRICNPEGQSLFRKPQVSMFDWFFIITGGVNFTDILILFFLHRDSLAFDSYFANNCTEILLDTRFINFAPASIVKNFFAKCFLP